MTDPEVNKPDPEVSCVLFLDVSIKGLRVPASVQTKVLEVLNAHLLGYGIRYTVRPDHFSHWKVQPDTVSILLSGEVKCTVEGYIKLSKCFNGKVPFVRTKVSLTSSCEGGIIMITGKLVAGPVSELSPIYAH